MTHCQINSNLLLITVGFMQLSLGSAITMNNAAFNKASRRNSIWILLWTAGCLENGGLYRGQSFAIKRTTLIVWKGSSKMAASIRGNYFQFKEQLSLAETDGHFRGSFGRFWHISQKCDTSDVPLRQILNANWQNKISRSRLWDTPRTQSWFFTLEFKHVLLVFHRQLIQL